MASSIKNGQGPGPERWLMEGSSEDRRGTGWRCACRRRGTSTWASTQVELSFESVRRATARARGSTPAQCSRRSPAAARSISSVVPAAGMSAPGGGGLRPRILRGRFSRPTHQRWAQPAERRRSLCPHSRRRFHDLGMVEGQALPPRPASRLSTGKAGQDPGVAVLAIGPRR